MAETKRLTDEDLALIRERSEKAEGNPLRDFGVFATQREIVFEDVPKLLAEIERLNSEAECWHIEAKTERSNSDRYREQGKLQHDRLKSTEGLADYYKSYADRVSEDIAEYKVTLRNMDALVDSVRYGTAESAPAAGYVADEITRLIAELERKVGEIV